MYQGFGVFKLCGVEQRAPLVFGRAAITLGIGPHSSLNLCSDTREHADLFCGAPSVYHYGAQYKYLGYYYCATKFS